MTRLPRHGEDGYSLIELLMVLSLVGVILATAFMMLQSITGMADRVEARTIASEDARIVMDRLTREIRQAFEVEDNQGAFADAQSRSCTFYTDLNRDGVPEMVTYRVQGKTLYRSEAVATSAMPPYGFGAAGPEETIITSLDGGFTGQVFTYYNSQDPPGEVSPDHPEEVSAVSVRVVNAATVNRKTAVVDLSTWVKVRAVHNTID
jgi:prepilin-type N-terminal cleavage/methylation domain-containing protein